MSKECCNAIERRCPKVLLPREIALLGNPNAGKTTLFNLLTGARQRTGNWPGVTVERKEGLFTTPQSQVKLVDLPGTGAKLKPETVTKALSHLRAGDFHQVQAQALTITQATECGTVYTPAEVRALKEAVTPRGLKLHMDGARFANALVTLGCTPAEITWKAGVDVLSFGGTKNGALAAEAVIFFDPAQAEEMKWRRKRAGQTLSKGRVLGAQFEGLLADDHWLDLARHANARAKRLADSVAQGSEARLAWPCHANEVFLVLPPAVQQRLKAAGIGYYDWSARSLPPEAPLKEGEVVGRFVMSFATKPEDVERLVAAIAG